jgi:hypothetical protein
MNRDDIVRMWEKANNWSIESWPNTIDELERFAKLVAAAEREGMAINGIHSCHSECQRPACVAVREAVAAEREACAKVCDAKVDDEYATGKVDHNEIGWTQACAFAIRERGAP